MLLIGESINASRRGVREALARRDADAIAALAVAQARAGADALDINGGDPSPAQEVRNMEWLVPLVGQHTDLPLAIDSANPQAVRVGLELARTRPIVNSISLEAGRLDGLLPLVARRECMVVALCMADEGVPTGVADRVERAGRLVEHLIAAGKRPDEIIVDPCFLPVASHQADARAVCEAIARIRADHPGVLVGGGVSNTSFGLPARGWIHLAILTLAIYHGMNAAIADPCQPGLAGTIRAAEVCGGADAWCAGYLRAHREGKLS